MELQEFLRWVVSGGGAGIIAYYILSRWGWYSQQNAERKRYLAILVTFVLADVFWLAMVWAGYNAAPANALGWVEQLFLAGHNGFGLSQVIHGVRELKHS